MFSKLDSEGQWVWARRISGDANGFVGGSGLGVSGELYIGGAFEGAAQFDATTLTSAGQRDGFVCRVDTSSGEVQWAQRIGGVGLETLQDLDIDPMGQPVITGWFQGSADFGPQVLTTAGTQNAPYIATFNSEGAFLQSYRLVPGTNVRSIVKSTIDSAGTVYTTGITTGIPRAQAPQQELTLSPTTASLSSYFIKLPPAAPTKFFVADDAARDRTYQYGTNGELTVDHFSFSTANTAPRGAASTAAGTKVWVVDANKTVYVYSSSGSLLGSWTAGGLTSNAQIEGITTNGTDIWLVDASQDKVFKYAGAGSRISGTQSAASSFKLNSANGNAKDLVTDGSSIWVVNDSSTDKVFKYSMSGSLVGSWTITSPGATSPTGITLNPASPSALWIVDNGSDKIYQYDSAVGRTSGSQAASATFVLAVGNTNPQGIADPPSSVSAIPEASSHETDAQPLPAGSPTIHNPLSTLSTARSLGDEPTTASNEPSQPVAPMLRESMAATARMEFALTAKHSESYAQDHDGALALIADELDEILVRGRRR